MDYKKHYNNLIQTRFELKEIREKEKKEGIKYYERHHIIPKSQGGTDQKENLVLLTAREHFIAHWLLMRFDPIKSNIHAFWRMCISKNTPERYTNSKAYEEARINFSNSIKSINSGKKFSEETKYKISESKKGNTYALGNKLSEESKLKISESKKNHTCYQNKERSEKISKANTGRKVSDVTKLKISESKKGKESTFKGCKHSKETKIKISQKKLGKTINNKFILQYDLEGNFIKEWSSQTEAVLSIGIKDAALISQCCRNKVKTAYGFKWEFKNE